MKKGYITIFLSLVFTIIMSLVLLLVEGVQTGATKLEAKIVTELAVDSCLAEYDRKIWDKYDLFFIDDAYGSKNGSVCNLEKHLSDYIEKNCKQNVIGKSNLLRLKNPYLEVEEVKFATDDYGKVWKEEAVHYMNTSYGLDVINTLLEDAKAYEDKKDLLFDFSGLENGSSAEVIKATDKMEAKEQNRLDEEREALIQSKISDKENELGRNLKADEIEEIESETPREMVDLRNKKDATYGISVQGMIDKLDEYRGKGILNLVIGKSRVSNKKIEREGLVTSRIPKTNNRLDLASEVLFNEYLFNHFGSYVNTKEDLVLNYEMEYILSGHLSDEDNLRAYAEKLMMLRMGLNYGYLKKDLTKQAQLQTVAAAVSMLILSPETQGAIYNVLQSIWIYAESINDLKIIFNGGKVPLYKNYDDWRISLVGAYKMNINSINDNGRGLDYKGYLRAMLLLLGGNNSSARSLDLVEKNLGINMSNCIYEFNASFGYIDDNGHNYVLSRKRNYE